MHKLNRAAWVLLLLTLPIAQAWAQAGTAAPRPTELGRLWARVARWKWQQAKPGQPAPAFDSSSVESFRQSVLRAASDGNPAGIATLYDNVLAKLGTKGYGGVSEQQFVGALQQVLTERATKNPAAPQAPAISQLVARLLAPDQGPPAPPRLPSDPAARPAAPPAQPAALDSLAAPARSAQQEAAQQEVARLRAEVRHLGWYRWATVALGALLLLALWRLWRFTGQRQESSPRKHSHSHTHQQPDEPAALQEQHNALSRRHDKLQQDFDDLAKHRDRLYQELEALRQQPPSPAPQPTAPAKAAPAPASRKTRPVPAPAVPAAAATQPHFAASPENRYLTHLYPESDAFRPLLVHLPARPDAAEATFEFNPAADQYFFTHNGVDQLAGAFTYAPPDWQRDPQTIRTSKPGTLVRDQSGWRVQEPARLELS